MQAHCYPEHTHHHHLSAALPVYHGRHRQHSKHPRSSTAETCSWPFASVPRGFASMGERRVLKIVVHFRYPLLQTQEGGQLVKICLAGWTHYLCLQLGELKFKGSSLRHRCYFRKFAASSPVAFTLDLYSLNCWCFHCIDWKSYFAKTSCLFICVCAHVRVYIPMHTTFKTSPYCVSFHSAYLYRFCCVTASWQHSLLDLCLTSFGQDTELVCISSGHVLSNKTWWQYSESTSVFRVQSLHVYSLSSSFAF